jgi:hypothetical protein
MTIAIFDGRERSYRTLWRCTSSVKALNRSGLSDNVCRTAGVATDFTTPVFKAGVLKSIVISNLTEPPEKRLAASGFLAKYHETANFSLRHYPVVDSKKHLIGTGLAQRANPFPSNKTLNSRFVSHHPSEPSQQCKTT